MVTDIVTTMHNTHSNFFYYGIFYTQILVCFSMILAFIRFILGPHAQDRVVSFDMLYNLAILLFISYAIKYGSTLYFDLALFIGALGFVSSIALAKFLMRGEIIE